MRTAPVSGKSTGRRAKLPTAGTDIHITIPSLGINEWTTVEVLVESGLCPIGAAVQVAVHKDITHWLRVGGATLTRLNRVSIYVSNIGGRPWPEGQITVQLHPHVQRQSLFPEVTFNLDEVKL